ncbi:MAG TPA: 3-hydroxyacyl-ACP dehydratase FabZ family protein [Thermoguttaceae bacterium]|nr:3-hydroxyacyl-ACP dehydratase FabZ family protein [Thermoguttaceae bacterium]
MHFSLIDRIVELTPGRRITALKNLSLAEEYLADHFPQFPVMPGVLMLEAMVQAGAWLVRASEDFAHSMVVLRQASNVKYGRFVVPGQTLRVEAEILGQTAEETRLKAQGTVEGQFAVGGRLVLVRYNLADTQPERKYADDWVRKELRKKFRLLYLGGEVETASSAHAGS